MREAIRLAGERAGGRPIRFFAIGDNAPAERAGAVTIEFLPTAIRWWNVIRPRMSIFMLPGGHVSDGHSRSAGLRDTGGGHRCGWHS